jgi:uncharacterized membrane protein
MTESEGKPAIQPGRTAERVGFFTDAVFAIAMTLLVIEIPRSEAADFEPGNGVSKSEAFLTGLVGNLAHRIYRGGGWPRLRIRPS